MSLAQEQPQSISDTTPALTPEEALNLAREVPEWKLHWDSIEREFKFDDFKQAVGFVNKVADEAEKENHHPDIAINYNKVHLALSTHKIGGLSKNDFILAARINELSPGQQ